MRLSYTQSVSSFALFNKVLYNYGFSSLFVSPIVTINFSWYQSIDRGYWKDRVYISIVQGIDLCLAEISVDSLRLSSIEFFNGAKNNSSDPLFNGASDISRATLISIKLVG